MFKVIVNAPQTKIIYTFFPLFGLLGFSSAKSQSLDFYKSPSYRSHLQFELKTNRKKVFTPDTAVSYSIVLHKGEYEQGYIWGKLLGSDSTHYYFETDYTYRNCNFPEIPYLKSGTNKYIAPIRKDAYLIEMTGNPKSKALNSASEVIAWTSFATLLLSPLVTIDFKKGKFIESRYFAINRIALPVFAVSTTLYLVSDAKKIKINNIPSDRLEKVYREKY